MGAARITQTVTEIVTQNPGNVRATQMVTEIVGQGGGELWVTQVTMEVLRSIGGTDPAAPPATGGLKYPVICCTM